jgi:hypothetical protein
MPSDTVFVTVQRLKNVVTNNLSIYCLLCQNMEDAKIYVIFFVKNSTWSSARSTFQYLNARISHLLF